MPATRLAARLRELDEAATKGPWEGSWPVDEGGAFFTDGGYAQLGTTVLGADALLIVELRSALPELAALVEALGTADYALMTGAETDRQEALAFSSEALTALARKLDAHTEAGAPEQADPKENAHGSQ